MIMLKFKTALAAVLSSLSFKNFKKNQLHLLLALDLILQGLNLINAEHFFFFPPEPPIILSILNSDVVGGFGVIVGLLIVALSAQTKASVKTNRWLIVSAGCFFGFVFGVELMHLTFANAGPVMASSLIGDFVMVLLTIYVAFKSNTLDDDY